MIYAVAEFCEVLNVIFFAKGLGSISSSASVRSAGARELKELDVEQLKQTQDLHHFHKECQNVHFADSLQYSRIGIYKIGSEILGSKIR